MRLKVNNYLWSFALISTLIISGCGEKKQNTTHDQNTNHIKVGAIAGAEFKVLETAAKVAKDKYNLDVELVEFNDYVIPNEALNRGDIDLNVFQHKQFLDEQIKTRKYKLVPVANTFIYPIAAYSYKINSIEQLKEGDTIAIPNDAANLSRSLLLLEKQGLIKLNPTKNSSPTILDIVENPKHLTILELEAPQLPRVLNDQQIKLAIINNAYASQVGLSPTENGIFAEGNDSPYVNVIVAREDNQHNDNVKTFIKAYQSDEVLAVNNDEFKGSSIKAW